MPTASDRRVYDRHCRCTHCRYARVGTPCDTARCGVCNPVDGNVVRRMRYAYSYISGGRYIPESPHAAQNRARREEAIRAWMPPPNLPTRRAVRESMAARVPWKLVLDEWATRLVLEKNRLDSAVTVLEVLIETDRGVPMTVVWYRTPTAHTARRRKFTFPLTNLSSFAEEIVAITNSMAEEPL